MLIVSNALEFSKMLNLKVLSLFFCTKPQGSVPTRDPAKENKLAHTERGSIAIITKPTTIGMEAQP